MFVFPPLAVVVEVPPEVGPTLFEAATNEDIRMVFAFFVADTVNPRGGAGKLADCWLCWRKVFRVC